MKPFRLTILSFILTSSTLSFFPISGSVSATAATRSTAGSKFMTMLRNQRTANLHIPQQCRAIYFGDYEEPVYERMTKISNKPYRNHLLIQVHAVGVNPVDSKHVIGDKLPHNWSLSRKWFHRLIVKNTRCGFDFAGVVAAYNDRYPNYPVGTRVYGIMSPLRGSFAEYLQVPVSQVAKASDKLTFEESAALPLVGLTAWQALSPYVIPNQSRVLVLGGSGGTGHVFLQLARALGAKDIVTVCSAKNIDFVKECGANQVIDYTKTNDIIKELQSMTRRQEGVGEGHDEEGDERRPFDLVMDCVTSGDPNDAQNNYPSRIRNPSYDIVQQPNHLYQRLGGVFSEWIRAGLGRVNIFPHSWLWNDRRERLFWINVHHTSAQLKELTKLANDGTLKPKVSKVYPNLTATSVQQAFDDVNGRHVQGKVVIRVLVEENSNNENNNDHLPTTKED